MVFRTSKFLGLALLFVALKACSLCRWIKEWCYKPDVIRFHLSKIGMFLNGGFVVAFGYRKGHLEPFISGPGRPPPAERLKDLGLVCLDRRQGELLQKLGARNGETL